VASVDLSTRDKRDRVPGSAVTISSELTTPDPDFPMRVTSDLDALRSIPIGRVMLTTLDATGQSIVILQNPFSNAISFDAWHTSAAGQGADLECHCPDAAFTATAGTAAPAPAAAPRTQAGGLPARNTTERARMRIIAQACTSSLRPAGPSPIQSPRSQPGGSRRTAWSPGTNLDAIGDCVPPAFLKDRTAGSALTYPYRYDEVSDTHWGIRPARAAGIGEANR